MRDDLEQPPELGPYTPKPPRLPHDVWALLRHLHTLCSPQDAWQALQYLEEEQRRAPRH
jgi:hypothetical protein